MALSDIFEDLGVFGLLMELTRKFRKMTLHMSLRGIWISSFAGALPIDLGASAEMKGTALKTYHITFI